MPPAPVNGSWLIPCFSLVLSMLTAAFSLTMGTSVPDRETFMWYAHKTGDLVIGHIRNIFQINYNTQVGANCYLLLVVLRKEPVNQEGDYQPDPDSYCIAPPSVPFHLPCHICQYPTEQGKYCPHTAFPRILCSGIKDPWRII